MHSIDFVNSGYQVVFHPSYSAPEEGEFSLQVTGAGSTGGTAGTPALQHQQSAVAPLKLKCIAGVRQDTHEYLQVHNWLLLS